MLFLSKIAILHIFIVLGITRRKKKNSSLETDSMAFNELLVGINEKIINLMILTNFPVNLIQ